MITPPVEVAEPTPEAAGFGLYSAATVLDPDDAHVQSGVEWESSVCGLAGAFPINCPMPEGFTPPLTGLSTVEALPFGVTAGYECKPVGTTLERMRELARARLRLTEQHAVERTFWTGDMFTLASVTSPHLAAGGDVDVLAEAPVKASLAIGLLEEALGNMTGAIGVIHAPRVAFGALKGMVSEARGVMRTELGTKVVFGTGYPGTGPAGEARTNASTWVFATGPVQVVRGPVTDQPGDLNSALNRETNVARVQASRIVSVGHACGIVAVPVDLTA